MLSLRQTADVLNDWYTWTDVDVLLRALESCPADEQEVLALVVFVDDLDADRLAVILGTDPDAADSLLRRGHRNVPCSVRSAAPRRERRVNDSDPIDTLRALADHRRQRIGSPPADAVVDRIVHANPPTPVRARPRRHRLIAIAVGIAVVGAGTTAVWALTRTQRAPNPTAIACHRTADLASSQVAISSDGSDPVTQCAKAWLPEWGPPPPLIACVAPTGIAVVFPGDETTCTRLGLTPLDTTLTADDRTLITFQDDLTTELGNRGCIPSSQVLQLVETRLTAAGLTEWTATIAKPNTPDQPCGSVDIDPAAKTITILPLPDMFTPPSTSRE